MNSETHSIINEDVRPSLISLLQDADLLSVNQSEFNGIISQEQLWD